MQPKLSDAIPVVRILQSVVKAPPAGEGQTEYTEERQLLVVYSKHVNRPISC